ncbi:MAG: HAD family hydrolase [Candidatus Hodarchaeota archaeon]
MEETNLAPLRCLIFDIDGTLVNTSPLIVKLYQNLFLKHKKIKTSLEDIIATFGPPEEQIIATHFSDNQNEALEYFLEEYERQHPETSYLSREELISLRAKGYLLTIFTGKGRDSLDITLKKLNLHDCFDFAVCGSDVPRSKPYPDGLQKIIETVKLKREQFLLIGDSPLDVVAARGADIRVAGVLWGTVEEEKLRAAEPDYLFEEPHSFLQWLNNQVSPS